MEGGVEAAAATTTIDHLRERIRYRVDGSQWIHFSSIVMCHVDTPTLPVVKTLHLLIAQTLLVLACRDQPQGEPLGASSPWVFPLVYPSSLGFKSLYLLTLLV